MKAVVQERYGPLEEVSLLRDFPSPTPGPGQVLVRTRAASVHVGDFHMLRGVPASGHDRGTTVITTADEAAAAGSAAGADAYR